MDSKNVVVSAFTRFRASNLGRAVTTKIYHRIRNVKNAERSEEGKKKSGRERKKENTGARGGRATAARRRRQQGVDP